MQILDKTFEQRRVDLDGNTFIRCHFVRCKLVFRAEGWPRFDGCLFTECEWVFDDGAELALEFLSWMYHGLSSAGPGLLDDVIENIKYGETTRSMRERSFIAPV